jgi:hypothetical protein
MTYLEAVNSVLRKLREDAVATVSENVISQLVGDFINVTKKEVEDSWKWNALRYTTIVTTSSGVFRYILTGSGDSPLIQDVWNDTDNSRVRKTSMSHLNSLFIDSSVQTGAPSLYGINGVSTDGDLQIDLYPKPDGVYSIDFNMVLSQADLSADSDIILVPSRVVELGAWALAVSERGEDGGASYNELDAKYKNALSDAISIDAANQHSSETTWCVN